MTWIDDTTMIVRALIDDTGTTYTDNRLEDVILVAAHMISKEFILDTEYTIDLSDASISSDPDTNFVNLVALKSSMIILNAEAKALATSAVRVKDGPSEIETGRGLNYLKALADNAANQYAVARTTLLAGNMKAIMTPFTIQNVNIGEGFS